MNKELIYVILSAGILFFSCIGQRYTAYVPVPDFSVYKTGKGVEINSIIGSRDGIAGRDGSVSLRYMPNWMQAYLTEGIEAVEKLDISHNKYIFIAKSESENLPVLTKWAENFSAPRDIPILAAERIEKRMIASASLYPDDEYGLFFERMIKNSYDAEYPNSLKEDTYWIKVRINKEENSESENVMYSEMYIFFILTSVDKAAMNTVIINTITKTAANVNSSAAQTASIRKLRQNFFEDF